MSRLLVQLFQYLQRILTAKTGATLLRYVLALWHALKRFTIRRTLRLEAGPRSGRLEESLIEPKGPGWRSEKEGRKAPAELSEKEEQSRDLFEEYKKDLDEDQLIFRPLESEGNTISLFNVAAIREPNHLQLRGSVLPISAVPMSRSQSASAVDPRNSRNNLSLHSHSLGSTASLQHPNNDGSGGTPFYQSHHQSSPNLTIRTRLISTSGIGSRIASHYTHHTASAAGSPVSLHVRMRF
jgi:hypothetical protein